MNHSTQEYLVEVIEDGNIKVMIGPSTQEAFKQLVTRGAGLWPDAPIAIKEIADLVTNGKLMQDYRGQAQAPKNGITHAEMVTRTKKKPEVIMANMSDEAMDCIHMVLGISGEAGELLDAVKKYAVYGKVLDRGNVVEELGDLEYYLEGLRQVLGIRRDDILAANIAKLSKRYNDFVYTDAAAIARADKA